MDANIALLGLSGSGKTNFISEAIQDINSFSPKISIEDHTSIDSKTEEFSNFSFRLKAYNGIQWNFNVCDYNGELIKTQEDNNEHFSEIKKHFQSSNAWIILLDANYFASGIKEEIVRLMKRKASRYLSPYISNYAEEHEEKPPELLFVITKANELIGKFSEEIIKDIVMESFESIFTPEYSPMILLSDTTMTKSAGLAILTLFYIRYTDELSNRILQLNCRNSQIEEDVKKLNGLIYEIEEKKILGKLPANKNKVENYRGQITSLRVEKDKNNGEIIQCKQNMAIKHLGTAVQCFIDNNPHLTLNGFDRIHYPYDKTMVKIEKIKKEESDRCRKIAIGINLLIIIAFIIYSIVKVGILKILVPVIALFIFAGLTVEVKNTGAKIFFGLCSIVALANIGSLSVGKDLVILAGYIVFLLITVVIAGKLDDKIGKKNIVVIERYKDEITLFFDSKVRGKK